MVNYILATEEQKSLATTAREILEKHLAPHIEEYEAADDQHGRFPREVLDQLIEAGYYGMNIPEEYGGLGLDLVTRAIIAEEMCKVEAGFSFDATNTGNNFPLILKSALPEKEKQAWADKILGGYAGSFAQTEPNAGSDAGAIRTTAVKDGNEWVINGTKCFISAGTWVDYFLVPAWTDKTQRPNNGITLFIVEKERGVQIGKKEKKMGMKLSETAEIIFEDVRVPEDHIIGEVGKGYGVGLEMLSEEGRLFDAVCALGIGQAALDCAVEYARTRRQFGKRIIDHQGLGFIIADMQIRMEAARSLLYQTAEAMDKGIKTHHLTSSVKTFVTDSVMQVTTDAVQVLGGYGYMKEYPVEKYMRDAKIYQIFGGTNQIQRMIIYKELAGKDSEKSK